jgi:N-formylglutamate amidohydrolase
MSQHDEADTEQVGASAPPPPFLVKAATGAVSPFVFAVPHSGRHYPASMRRIARLSDHALRLSEDAYVDELMAGARAAGASLLVATHARAYLDLNRGEAELDPAMFTPALDEGDTNQTHRVRAGLGIIPRLVAEGLSIYDRPLPAREAFHRIETVYRPYHQQLDSLLAVRQRHFGQSVLIDCHSMPSEARQGRKRTRASGPDIVLGDNWGAACARELTALAEELLLRAGFSVRRNVPYSGGFTTQHYGNPGKGLHALQIEINRAIYMDERSLEPLPHFAEVRDRFTWFAAELIAQAGRALPRLGAAPMPRAAE